MVDPMPGAYWILGFVFFLILAVMIGSWWIGRYFKD
jgi:hypothetical protein